MHNREDILYFKRIPFYQCFLWRWLLWAETCRIGLQHNKYLLINICVISWNKYNYYYAPRNMHNVKFVVRRSMGIGCGIADWIELALFKARG